MGHQVNFHATPVDIETITANLKKLEPLVVLHSYSSTEQVRSVESLIYLEHGAPWLYFFLARPADLKSIVTRHVPTQGYWSIDVVRSPVVEFNSCFFDGKTFRSGRVYYTDSYYDTDNSLVPKSEAFTTWAKAVLAGTRKSLKKRGHTYAGPDAERWLKESEGAKLE